MVSESGEIIRRLIAAGANTEDIGRALGRNRSLISQVQAGKKPGHNLRDALAQLEAQLSGAGGDVHRAARAATVAAPARRTTAGGSLARVRKPVTVSGRSWTVSTVKRTAVRNGARGLGHVLQDGAVGGRQVAVTVSVDHSVIVEAYGRTGRHVTGRKGSADFRLGDAEEVLSEVEQSYGGDVALYIADRMLQEGLVQYDGTALDLQPHIVEIDMRTFD